MYTWQKKRRMMIGWGAVCAGILFLMLSVWWHYASLPPKGFTATVGTVIETIPENDPRCFEGSKHGMNCTSVIQYTTATGQTLIFQEHSKSGNSFGDGTKLNVAYETSDPSNAKTLPALGGWKVTATPGVVLTLGGIVYVFVLRRQKAI